MIRSGWRHADGASDLAERQIRQSILFQDPPRRFNQGIAQIAVMTLVSVSLSDGQYAALCDFVYNVGATNLQKSELLRAVNAKQFDRVPTQMLRWVNAGGRPIAGLKTRRNREIDLFFDGLPMPRDVPPAGEDVSPIDIRTGR